MTKEVVLKERSVHRSTEDEIVRTRVDGGRRFVDGGRDDERQILGTEAVLRRKKAR